MLGWNLLQIHNHYVVDMFFRGIRAELKKGLDNFEEQRRKFLAAYVPELPEGTGERPRARGYHFKSEAGQDKINKSTWVDLDQKVNGQAGGNVEHKENGTI
jgi:queuine tRNA-ribosyltransferase